MDPNIKEQLSKILHSYETLPFLFIGAGLSRRYFGAESWEELLKRYAILAQDSEFGFVMYQNMLKDFVCEVGESPKLASLIEQDFNKNWLTASKYREMREKHRELVFTGVSPLKIDIAEHLKSIQSNIISDYEREVLLFKNLSGKNVAGIITTNYDNFLEECFESYEVYIGQEQLIFSSIQSIGEIYKIHGCVSKPETIVLNEEDYIKFNKKNAYLAAKILTIFLEHPIIFIGYSINDANIEEILKSIMDCLNNEQLEKLKDRFIFVEWNNTGKEDSIKVFQKSFEGEKKIEMTHLLIRDYSTFYESLSEIKAKYKAPLLRRLKEEIADLVLTNEPTHKLKVINLEDDKLDQLEVVVGVGIINDLASKGYEGITVPEIFEDVIFDNKNFDFKALVEKSIPVLLKRHSNSIPFYKYIKGCEREKLDPKIKSEIKTSFNRFLNRTILNKKPSVCLNGNSVKALSENYTIDKALEYICYLDEDRIHIDELEVFLKKIVTEEPELLGSNLNSKFRKVVMIYDWLKYYK